MTNVKELIMKLREVRKERNLSYGDIMDKMEENGDFVSKSTLSRLFSESTTDFHSFRYEDTIRPIAKVLLDMENIEETDDMDTKALKSLLKYKMQMIEDLEKQIEHLNSELDKEKIKHHEKIDKEREQFQTSLNFLKTQVDLKDKRIDQLMDSNMALTDHFLNCPYKQGCKDNE